MNKQIIEQIKNNPELKKKIADALWPNSSTETKIVSISRLLNNNKKTLKFEWVKDFCEILGVTPNEFFAYPWGENHGFKQEVKRKVKFIRKVKS